MLSLSIADQTIKSLEKHLIVFKRELSVTKAAITIIKDSCLWKLGCVIRRTASAFRKAGVSLFVEKLSSSSPAFARNTIFGGIPMLEEFPSQPWHYSKIRITTGFG